MRSFTEFLLLREDNQTAPAANATDLLHDLLHLSVGDKLLYKGPFDRESQPIHIASVNLDVADSNKMRVHRQFGSVREAADFADTLPNLQDGTMEVYFDATPIYLLNWSNGRVSRHPESDGLIQRIKTTCPTCGSVLTSRRAQNHR